MGKISPDGTAGRGWQGTPAAANFSSPEDVSLDTENPLRQIAVVIVISLGSRGERGGPASIIRHAPARHVCAILTCCFFWRHPVSPRTPAGRSEHGKKYVRRHAVMFLLLLVGLVSEVLGSAKGARCPRCPSKHRSEEVSSDWEISGLLCLSSSGTAVAGGALLAQCRPSRVISRVRSAH
ncbi:hypothetical protein B0I35DRAFT_417612 [Stachybotrys elegans]|uniref:Uncharacterized protein n=1 Tax=Stachybotrys elegans TaxID=80388 RepID=A0A8K0T1P9_9HYPO|nr:hypothetical protein B0I35DRAFT_417612 [Stachybotrys elegans]